MRLKVLIIISLFFLFIHCEKETPVDSGVKMNSLYPEYDWQPLLIPQGIESSTDSMAQVIHGYFKLANSLEDYTRWCYFPPSDFEYMNEHIKRIPKEGFNTWEVSFDRWGIEIYKEPVNVQLKVSETESEYYWESYINARVQDPVIGTKVFDDVLYIESGASKDFKTGYMMRRFIWDERALNCVWEWEISDINETYNMSVVLNDLSKVKLDWPLPENTPGRADIVLNASLFGEMKFYKIKDQKFILHFNAQWGTDGNGQYWIYDQDGSQIIRQGKW